MNMMKAKNKVLLPALAVEIIEMVLSDCLCPPGSQGHQGQPHQVVVIETHNNGCILARKCRKFSNKGASPNKGAPLCFLRDTLA